MSQTKPKELLINESSSSFDDDDKNVVTNKSNSKQPLNSKSAMPNVQNVGGHSVILGQLPDNFLRLDPSDSSSSSSSSSSNHHSSGENPNPQQRSQIELDEELAASLQQQYDSQAAHMAAARSQWNSNFQAYLSITFVEAHLVKNYGLMNMNLYVRIRVGNTIYETRTSHKSGKNPKWNETCRCYLPIGTDSIGIEVYDDCLFTQDELIAWATYKIPENFLRFTGETPEHTFEEKIVLSGKQGEGMEGELFLAINTKPVTQETMRTYLTTPVYVPQPGVVFSGPPILAQPLIVHQTAIPASTLLAPQDQTPTAGQTVDGTVASETNLPILPNDEDVKKLAEMFPKIEIDIIKSVLLAERGNLERSITNLLELNSTT